MSWADRHVPLRKIAKNIATVTVIDPINERGLPVRKFFKNAGWKPALLSVFAYSRIDKFLIFLILSDPVEYLFRFIGVFPVDVVGVDMTVNYFNDRGCAGIDT